MVTRRGSCVVFLPSAVKPPGTANALDITLPSRGIRVTAEGGPATVAVRRFADEVHPVGTLAASASAVLRIGPDLAPQPWHARVAPADRATVCGLA
jgi:hypothetical protein